MPVAVVTHKGASAEGGHYIAWVKKDELQPTTDAVDNADDEWFKFDDDKVSRLASKRDLSKV